MNHLKDLKIPFLSSPQATHEASSSTGGLPSRHKTERSSSVLPRHNQDIDPPGSAAPAPFSPDNASDRVQSLSSVVIEMSRLENMPVDVTQAIENKKNSTVFASDAARRKNHDERLQLSSDIVAEETRPLDQELIAQYLAVQLKIISTDDFSLMPQAQALLMRIHNLTQEHVDAGFKDAGAWHSYRNMPGSLINLVPLALIFEMNKEQYHDDPAALLKFQAGYLVATIAATIIGTFANARALIQTTPLVDASFNGAPNIAPELSSTPSYQEIKKELEEAECSVKDDVPLQAAIAAYRENPDSEELKQAVIKELDRADAADRNTPGKKHFFTRAQLHRVYIEGLRLQATVTTAKGIGTMAAGWVGFFTNPVVAAYTLIGFTVSQILAQRVVAPHDQVRLQNLMWELMIISRPLSGDQASDDAIMRSMVRTPLEVRANSLEGVLANYLELLEQDMAALLKKADPAFGQAYVTEAAEPATPQRNDELKNLRNYMTLKQRTAYPQQMQALASKIDAAIDARKGSEPEPLADLLAKASGTAKNPLIAQIADKIGVPKTQYSQFVALNEKSKKQELDETELASFVENFKAISNAYDALPDETQYEIKGLPGLREKITAATVSRDYALEAELCDQLAEKLALDPADIREYHYLDMHQLAPLDEAEQTQFAALQSKMDSALNKMTDGQKEKLEKAEQRYQDIGRDPQHIKERRFADVSDEHAKLTRDGMQVTRNDSHFSVRPETEMLLRDGHKRAGNAPEFMSNYSIGINRAYQSYGLSSSPGMLSLNALSGTFVGVAKLLSDDPKNFHTPLWPKILTTGISAGAWTLNSVASHRVGEARVSPLSTWDQVGKNFGGTSPYAETILQVAKLDNRTALRNDPDLQERGVMNVLSRYLGATFSNSLRGLNNIHQGGENAKNATHAFHAYQERQKKAQGERDEIRASLEPSTSATP
jgi:hypothetical protein